MLPGEWVRFECAQPFLAILMPEPKLDLPVGNPSSPIQGRIRIFHFLAIQPQAPVAISCRREARRLSQATTTAPIAEFARLLPILPLIGGGHTRLQPVFVEDVGEAIASILTNPETVGQIYELAGPGVYTLRELVTMTLHLMRKRRLLIPCPLP